MGEWGRKEYSKPWPSRMRVWTLGAFFLSGLFFVFLTWWDGRVSWTAAQRLYLADYLKSGTRTQLRASQTRYRLLEGVTAKGGAVLVTGDEVEPFAGADGKVEYRLTDEGVKAGLVRLQVPHVCLMS